jgi:hypothetical protein
LLPAHSRPKPTDRAVDLDDPELAASTTGRLLAIRRALRDGAQLRSSYRQLVDTLGSLLTPDTLLGGGTVHTAIIGASLRALVRCGAYQLVDPMIRSARAGAESRGRSMEIAGYALVQAESWRCREGSSRHNWRSSMSVSTKAEHSISAWAWNVDGSTHANAARSTQPDSGHCHDGGPRARRARGVGRHVPRRDRGRAAAGRRLGKCAQQLRPTRRIGRTALRAQPSFARGVRVAAGRSPCSTGTAKAQRWRRRTCASRQFGSPVTIAAALAVSGRFQPAQQIALLEEAIAMIAGTPPNCFAATC